MCVIASLVLQRLHDGIASEAFNSFQPHDGIGAVAPTNSRKRQRRKSLTSNPAPVREPHTFFSVCEPWASPLWLAIRLLASGIVERNPGPQRRRQLAGLVRHALSTSICSLVQWCGLLLLPGPTLWWWLISYNSGHARCCWRWSLVRPELRSDGHKTN